MPTHASIAERIAFGRPFDAVNDDAPATAPRPKTALVGRILLAGIFLISGIAKLADPAGAAGYMTSAGIPAAEVLVYIAAFAEILGALSILFGFLTRVGALGLVVFLAIVNLTMHAYWGLEGQERAMQMSQFMKNLAVMGGLLVLVANGPGRHSVDAKIRRNHA